MKQINNNLKNIIILSLIVIVSITGCGKEDTPTNPDGPIDNGLASEYAGILIIERTENDYRVDRTDSINLLTVDNRYKLTHISGSTNLCDTEGDLTVNLSTSFVTLNPDPTSPMNCDKLRIPDGVFAAIITSSTLNLFGTSLIKDENGVIIDTVVYDFSLNVITP